MNATARDIPPGWDENPTAWPKRVRIALLALTGLCVSGYLALYQVGVLRRVWDPLFGHGAVRVLELMHPVPDAAVGAAAYTLEIALSFVGGADRWRTRPWAVVALGAVTTAGAATGTVLMAVQPLVARAWCAPCLASAAVSLVIFGSAADEPLAALQHLARERRRPRAA